MSKHPDAKPSGFPALAVDYVEAAVSPGEGWMLAYLDRDGRTRVWRRIRLLGMPASNKQEARK